MVNLNHALNKLSRNLKSNSPVLLCIVAAVGVAATGITTALGTVKAIDILDAKRKEQSDELTKGQIAAAVWPCYIPSALIAAGTVICIFGANYISKQQYNSLLAAYTLLDQSAREFKQKFIDIYGLDKEHELENEIAKDNLPAVTKESELPLWYDPETRRYFNTSVDDFKKALYTINHDLTINGFVSLDEFFMAMGIEPSEAANHLGWDIDWLMGVYEMPWIDIHYETAKTDDGLEVNVIYYDIEPEYPEASDYIDYYDNAVAKNA